MADEIDVKTVLSEYLDADYDFGFSAVSEEEYNSVIDSALTAGEHAVEEHKRKLKELEKLIVPFLVNLLKTADKEYIYWPNRKPTIEKQIEKIVKLTRS
jgi:hypothetical protein